jgi:Rrf2 family nitric oxide-sensitive transcriptional repressor
LIYLALKREQLVTRSEISKAYHISENHLMKIVHRLAKQGYIETHRGKGGGMRLAREPDEIVVGAVVRDIEENLNIAECFDPKNHDCPMLPACVLKSALMEARESFFATLDTYTLSNLIANKLAAASSSRVETLVKLRK